MKFILAITMLVSIPAFAKASNTSLLSVRDTANLCPQLGNWSGFYTRDEAFIIECRAPQAAVSFNLAKSGPFTQVTRNRYMMTAIITDASETYDMINSVGTYWRGQNMEIVCQPKSPGSRFADWCRVSKLLNR